MSTTLITNGIVVDAGTMRPLDILISGERVESLLPRGSEVRADRVIDASGRYVLPGIIDAHNHPVYADRIDRLSRAALSGGVTTVIPYIGAVAAWGKQGGLVQAIDDFIREGETGSCIDFGLHCTLTANVMEEADEAIPELVARGVISFKAFTSYRKRGMKLEDDQILHLMELVAREKALLAFHAENDAILEYLEAKAVAEGREHPRDYPATHPNISEAEAIFRVLSLANIYLPHVTCKESLEAIRLFRKWGTVPTLFAETCPHYLTLDDSQLALRGNLAKMSPPLRKEADREALWEAIRNGEIQVVASDAAGHATAANEPLFAETFRAPHGAPGVDTLFCVTWNEGIAKGRVAIPDLVRLLCENPAKCFGLYPRKGTLLPGSDADVVIVEGVVHGLALAAELDELAGFQQPQLVADGTLGDAHNLGNIVDAEFALKQRIQNFDAGGIAKDAEQLGQIIKHLVVGQVVLQTADGGLVQLGGLGGAFGRFFALCQCHHPFICLFVHMIHPEMGFVKRKTQKKSPECENSRIRGGIA